MSSYGKLEVAIEITVGAYEFYDMVVNRPHHVPNNKLDGVATNQADSSSSAKVGSISSWKYFQDGKAKVCQAMIEALDSKKHSTTWKIVEGELLDHYKSFKFILQIITTPNPKATVHMINLEYEKMHDDVADPYFMLQTVTDNIKDIDAHLLTQSRT
ncbi:MLP-like protein 34 [Rosa rugosa]|uniref:MLP-like protein 34 n=1 Tax=Rosa rugosa TaxID=74645 RepID=UPI002B417AA5|nr:MLP-like protein 34 [Rosa rugosa]